MGFVVCGCQQRTGTRCGSRWRQKGGTEEPEDHALGRSRGGFGTKIHPPRRVTDGGGTPLAVHVTAGQAHESSGFEEVVEVVRVPQRCGRQREIHEGLTPLQRVVSLRGQEDVVPRLLIQAGADVNARETDGDMPLHRAALYGRTDVVKLLLDEGADPNAQNMDGETPVTVALERGREGIVELLKQHRAKE